MLLLFKKIQAYKISSALNKVIKSFPCSTIQPIVGKSTYETLAEVHFKLNTNEAYVHLHLSNRQLGILFLTISPAIFSTQSNIVFVPPANPGPSPVIPQGLPAAQIVDTCRKYDVDSTRYTKYDMTDKELLSLLIAAVDKTYIWFLG